MLRHWTPTTDRYTVPSPHQQPPPIPPVTLGLHPFPGPRGNIPGGYIPISTSNISSPSITSSPLTPLTPHTPSSIPHTPNSAGIHTIVLYNRIVCFYVPSN